MRKLGFASLAIMVAGCATDPVPNFYNGKYYMAGDDNCVMMRGLSPAG